MKQLGINMVDGLDTKIKRNFGVLTTATAAQLGAILTAYKALTDCGVTGGLATEKMPALAPTGFTASTAAVGARYWREARITVALDPHSDGGGQSVGTINIPGIKDVFVSNGSVVDSGGLIAAFLTLFLTAGVGRISDGQAVSSATIISSYVENLAHPESDN